MTFCTSTPSGGVCFVVSLFPTIAWTSLPASDGSLVKWTPPQCILIKYYLYCNLVFILHTFESRIECSFSSSTGQNLGFDDKFGCPGFEEAKNVIWIVNALEIENLQFTALNTFGFSFCHSESLHSESMLFHQLFRRVFLKI